MLRDEFCGIRMHFHIHTSGSYDGMASVEAYASALARAGGRCMAVFSDHDVLTPVPAGLPGNVTAVPGIEVTTDAGDIIGFPLLEPVRARRWQDVMEEIRRQGGYVVLPHPYHGHPTELVRELAAAADCIEVFNARLDPARNARAEHLCRQTGKIPIVGSDAHAPGEAVMCWNRFGPDGNVTMQVYSPRSGLYLSQLVKNVKRRTARYALRNFLRFLWFFCKEHAESLAGDARRNGPGEIRYE